MAIGKISGPMLQSNLERQGVDLAFESNVLYLDVTNRRVGANTATPNAELQVVGNANIGNVFIHGNTITSTTGVLDFGSNANITITGGEVGRVLTTDGAGTLTWELVSSLATGFGNITINQNTITTNTLDGNLELTANGNGVVTTLTYDFYAANVITANVTANYINGNVRAADVIATGNITAPYFIGNLDSTTVTATGNITAPYFIGNIQGYLNGNVNATTVDATGNITAPYLVGNIVASTVDVSGNVVAPYFIGNLEGNVNGNVAATSVVVTGNVDAAYFNGNLRATDVISTGNVTAPYFVGNLDGTVVTLTGNITAPYFVGNVQGYLNGNVSATTVDASGNVTAPYFVGNVDSTTVTATGNITAPYFVGNLTGTTVTTTGNITAPYVLAEFVGNLTGNVTGNVNATTVDATGNVTAPYFVGNVDSTTVTATGNITAPYVIGNVEGNVNAMLITAGNVNADYFNGNLRGTDVIAGNISSGNSYITATLVGLQDILISGNTISSLTTDLVLSANLTNPNNIVRFDSVSAFDIPAGTTAQRPPNPDFGFMRVNTDLTTIEFWGGTDWIPITSGITNQVIVPDGITDTYTLNQITTTAGILVNINGTIQQADVAYSIVGDQITFAEIPLTTDIVEIRYLSAGVISAPYNGGPVYGNVIPGANVTYSLGNSTHWWEQLYTGNINISGNINTTTTAGTPLNTVAPSGWLKVYVSGVEYFMPLYQ
jgi:cytoskeletal protein CcmA (bactofilin family)